MVTAIRRCISADSHVTEPPDTYTARIDKAYLDRAPRLIEHPVSGATMLIDAATTDAAFGKVPYGLIAGAGRPREELGNKVHTSMDQLHQGGFDPKARLEDQDRDGVVAEIIYPSVGMLLCNHPDLDYKRACFTAYNLWLAEFCDAAPDRLIGAAQTALRSPDEGIADLEKIKGMGFRAVMLPGFPGVEDYDHPVYDEFWDAVVDLGLVPSWHILTTGQVVGSKSFRGPKVASFLGIIRGNQDIIGMMIFGGVFDRHPRLRIVSAEADAGWVPHWMYRADHAHDRHQWLESEKLQKPPSEYFRENVYVTFQDDWVAFETRHMMNVDRLLWANDFPHTDSTWPWSQEMLTEHTAGMTEREKDRILRDNTRDLYGLTA